MTVVNDLQKQLSDIQQRGLSSIAAAKNSNELQEIQQTLFGRKHGELSALLRELKHVQDLNDKKQIGEQANTIKQELQVAYDKQVTSITKQSSSLSNLHSNFDITLPGIAPNIGHVHPLRQVQNELVEIFYSMGFSVYEGNELENERYCFEYLNIPPSHPARDLQDTFYVDSASGSASQEPQVLRTHTSNMQVRIMEKYTPPLRVIVPGRVFRNEAIDSSHEHTFYQMEGFVVDEHITIANLTYVLKEAMSKILQRDVKLRLRPGYFPYVEPGFEADCSTEDSGWLEMLGCGMIHPKVFESAGYDPGKYTGFAFGMGINRLAMLKYGIKDIRHFMSGDKRVLGQF